MDVTRPESVEGAASSIEAQFERLDVLVNNAGINDPADGPPSAADSAAVARVIETNFLGAFRVTRVAAVAAKGASGANRECFKRTRFAYVEQRSGMDSRVCQAAWVLCLKGGDEYVDRPARLRTTETAIKVNSANPGYTATALNGFRGTQTVQQGAVAPVRLALLPADGPTGGSFDANGPQPW